MKQELTEVLQALSSVFKGKVNAAQNSEAGLERCLISVQDNKNSTVCRLVVQMMHRNGPTPILPLTIAENPD